MESHEKIIAAKKVKNIKESATISYSLLVVSYEKRSHSKRFGLLTFNGIATFPLVHIEIIVTLGEGRDIMTVDL